MATPANTHSLEFDGTSDYISIADEDQTGLSITSNLTIMFWATGEVPISGGGGNRRVAISKYSASSGGYEVALVGLASNVSGIEIRLREDASTEDVVQFSGSNLVDGVGLTLWTHHTFVVDYSSGTAVVRYYRNGTLRGTDSSNSTESIGTNTQEFAIGARSGGPTGTFYSWIGKIDEVKIYDAALPVEMIIENMRESLPLSASVSYWPLNEHLFDMYDNGNNLSIAAGAPAYDTDVPFANVGRTQRYIAGAGDGDVRNNDVGWETTRNAVNGDALGHGNTTMQLQASEATFGNETVYRVFVPIDTTGQDDSLFDAYLKVTHSGTPSTTGSSQLVLVQTTQASTSALEIGDYSKCGSVNSPEEGMARVNKTPLGKFMRLNSTGLGWINLTGFTKLGLRLSKDVDNSPTGGNDTDTLNNIVTSENAIGSTSAPYLDIVDGLTPQDIESGGTEATPDTGGEDRDPGGQGTPGYIPGGSGSANGGSSAGETALFFFAWLDT